MLLIEELPDGRSDIAVYASAGFKEHPKLKLAPLGQPRPAAKVTPLPRRAAQPQPVPRPSPRPAQEIKRAAPVVPLRPRKLKSTVALNENVERQVVNEFRRLIQAVSHYT